MIGEHSIHLDAERAGVFREKLRQIVDVAEALKVASQHFQYVSPDRGEMCSKLTTEAFTRLIDDLAGQMMEILDENEPGADQ